MRLGWQGFCFEHPEGWSPGAFAGNRRSGSVRLAAPARVAFRVRWTAAPKAGELEGFLHAHFSRLARAAQRRRSPFESHSEWDGEHLLFRWAGEGQGRGAVFVGPGCGRIFLVEGTGARRDDLASPLAALLESFRSGAHEGLETWALGGLDLSLPEGLRVVRKVLLQGRTVLGFRGRGAKIEAERWASGGALLSRHGLEPWARAVLRMRAGSAEQEHWGLRIAAKGRVALVRFDEFEDQMILLSVRGGIRPEWDWIV